jgi:hypothetical protein
MEGQSCRNEIRRDASNNLEANVQIRNPVLTKNPTGHQVKVVLEQRMNLDIGIEGLRGITDESRSYQTETHHRPVIASQKRMRRFQLECIGIIWLLWIRSGKLAKHGIDGGGRVSWIRDSEYTLRVILEQTLMRRMI